MAAGFATSLARPGGNVTGLANLFEQLTPKQLQRFKETVPEATRVALLFNPAMDSAIQTATARASLHWPPSTACLRSARQGNTCWTAA